MSRILITSALPYINGIKHLGNLAGSMLPADVWARFMRSRGHDVLYVCATDEHGTPAELAAAAAGQDVRTYCDEQHEVQKKAADAFSLSFDIFGRSSNAPNTRLTQHFAKVLEERGLIEERVDRMIYSIDDARFLPDRYVEGTCPHCGYEKARGDQCDNCGRLLDPTDLINPYSAVSGSRNLEVRDTRHLYLLQTKVADEVRAWVDARSPQWQPLARSIAYKHLDEGLIDRGITRDLKWGVPVVAPDGGPRPGMEGKVFYVWFDAPIEYIGATEEWADKTGGNWRSWWRLDEGAEDVRYVQFMGKDNVAFHTVSFPATILGSGEPWKTVDQLKAFNWLNWYGGKFSTSMGRGVFMDQALELLPADYWRWHLTAYGPEHSDAAFTWEQFQSTTNKDLADVLGNFVNRIVKFTESKFDGVAPEGGEPGALEDKLAADVKAALASLTYEFEAMEFRKAAQAARALWVLGNEYLQEAAPWTALKTDRERAAVVVRTGLSLVALFARVTAPFMPEAATRIAATVGATDLSWPDVEGDLLNLVPAGQTVAAAQVLFAKIEDAQVAEWTERFGGAEGVSAAFAVPILNALSPERRVAIRERLHRTGRAQIDSFLTEETAGALYELARDADYNVVTRRGSGHVDLPSAWLASLQPAQKQSLGQAVQKSASDGFQYLYDNYPVFDLVQAGQAGASWRDLAAFLNGEGFLGLMRDLTGEDRIAQADMQVTRYRTGHFLTEHDDHAEGKNRYFAYVLNLTPGWRIDWGGLLAFHGEDGNVAEAFTPRFNTLNLLRVPTPHSVTQVALSAGGDRISITGWLRGR